MEIRLDGRVALVTGGSLGLGLATARLMAASGASVAIAARRRDLLDAACAGIIAAGGRHVQGFACDVTRADEIDALYRDVTTALGRVDILVNNAGQSAAGRFEDVTDAQWQADIDLKLMSAIRLCRLALPDMKGRGWGRILNVLNIGAKAPTGNSAPTSVTRAAGLALTKVLAHEGAAHGVLVNAILPGILESDQWAREHKPGGPDPRMPDRLAQLALKVPLGRIGTAQEFANLACFLASDAASYITGCAINADGGMCPLP
ncbi:MAG: SDR family oxidoreductase [Gammaproteobacteria bacterium]